MDREHWRALAARHGRCDTEPRRCRACAAYWPCWYRLRADGELHEKEGRLTLPRVAAETG